jgi:hypothetical protein
MGIFDRLLGQRASGASNEFRILLEQSMEDLRIKTAAHDRLWRLGQAAWAIDQDAGTIVFTSSDGITATCAVQIIGTYNTADGTWLWGWDHPSVRPALQEDARKVKTYGEKHSLTPLTTRKLTCTEEEAWEFAALACKLCDAQGAYRGPAGPTRVFVIFKDVRLNKSGEAGHAAQATGRRNDRPAAPMPPATADVGKPEAGESRDGLLTSGPAETVLA